MFGIFKSSAPALADGVQHQLRLDSAGRLVVAGSIDQTTPGTTNLVSVTSTAYTSSANFTPANAAHSANDTMGAAATFASIGPSGGTIRILGCKLLIEHTAIVSGETSYLLYLYNVTPPSALADGDAFDVPSGDRASFLGYIELGTPVDLGSTLYVQTKDVNLDVKLAGTSLFAYLVTVGAFTPTAAIRKVTLHAVA